MNISQISFCGREQNQYVINNSKLSQQAAETRAQLRQNSALAADTYEFSTRPVAQKTRPQAQKAAKNIQHKKTKTVNADKYNRLVKENSIFRCLALGLSAIGCVACLSSEPAEGLDAATIHADYGTSISQLAEIYGTDADVILEANDLESDRLSKSMKLIIPSEYNPINDEIKELQEKLFSSNLDKEERKEIENQILNLQNQVYLQNEIAKSYTDGEFVYFKITLPTDETATHTQGKYNGQINVETFKNIFNIEDGAIKDNNNIGFEWTECGTVMEYSNQDLYDGQIVKIPADSWIIK